MIIASSIGSIALLLISMTVVESTWIEFEDVGYPKSRKLDLSGGANTDTFTYTARNNIAVVRSSTARHKDGNHYFLSNLFDGSLYTNNQGFSSVGDAQWLGQTCSTTEPVTITITFDVPQDISYIAVSAKNVGATDRWSWYAIDAYEDAADVVSKNVVKAVHITQMIDTDADHGGQFRAHPVKGKYEVLVFHLLRRSRYCSFNEIEIFVKD